MKVALTLHDLLEKNLESRADHPAVTDGEHVVTYGQLADRVNTAAAWLDDRGIKRGDRVGVHLRKSVEEVVATFAAARIGAVVVNINAQWTPHQLNYVLADCGAACLFTDSRRARDLAHKDMPTTLKHIVVKGEAPDSPLMNSWANIHDDLTAPAKVGIDVDVAALLYTSGSTGQPKGVMLSNRNLLSGATSVATYLKNRAEDRILSLLPLSFDYGFSQLTTMFLCGGTIELQKVTMPAEIVKTLRQRRIDGFAAVPPVWIQVARYLSEQKEALPALRYITNSGGKIPDNVLRMLPEVFPSAEIYLMYGFTEAFRSTYLGPERYLNKMGSIGRAIPNVETFVVNPELGVCGPGQQGELVHRGSLVSMGYWGRPDLTSEKIKPCPQLAHLIGNEEVCYSGDLVRIDDDGDYWFVGRTDAMIKSSGFRISPTEVEDIVSKVETVEHVVAFGVPDDELGEVVHIAVSGADGHLVDAALVASHCMTNMPSYMVPREIRAWDGAFPLTSSGKLDRPAIRRTCLAEPH